MSTRRGRWSATVAVAGLTAITGLSATVAQANPSATGAALTITVKQAGNKLIVSPSSGLRAGAVTINYSVAKGDHELQVAQLHKGYAPQQLGKDVEAGLENGSDLKAIGRLDHDVTWLGGIEAANGATGTFSTVLPRGTVYFFDQNSSARAKLQVAGPAVRRPTAASSVVVKAIAGNFWNAPATLPKNGWVNLRNNTTEPHFFALNRVKESTTDDDIRAYIKSGSNDQPGFALRQTESSGVFSPHTTTAVKVHLPAGKYLIACFWPDDESGMPHFNMGMWKLVHLK